MPELKVVPFIVGSFELIQGLLCSALENRGTYLKQCQSRGGMAQQRDGRLGRTPSHEKSQ